MSETPVLVGIAQNEQRPVDPQASKEPLALMLEAVQAAAENAGAPALLTDASSVRVVRGIWPYKNPARVIADAVGCPTAETRLSQFGGNFVPMCQQPTSANMDGVCASYSSCECKLKQYIILVHFLLLDKVEKVVKTIS